MSDHEMKRPAVEITICMGSSCFSRGNKRLVGLIKDYLADNDLDETVEFKGSHCMGRCEKGPVLKINDQVYCQTNPSSVTELLDQVLFSMKTW